MFIDAGLAIAHHILVFGMMGMIAAQTALVRPGMPPDAVAKVARIDRGYGGIAGLIVIVGVARVICGAKGSLFYTENPWFWAKMAAFVLIALMSISPTRHFIRWGKALKADAGFTPPELEIGQVLPWLRVQGLMILAVVTFAAVMARYGGF